MIWYTQRVGWDAMGDPASPGPLRLFFKGFSVPQSKLYVCDCLRWTKLQRPDCVDLVMCSPPYEDCRLYDELGFRLKGQRWVDWAVERFVDQYRICRGLVCWVIEGKTSDFRWSATPALFMADLHRRGIHLRKPPIFHRVGIPGSGGPDFWRNDYEFIVCASKGKLPWSDNTAMGEPCKHRVGGEMSYRTTDGTRRNELPQVVKVQTRRKKSGERLRDGVYRAPKLANPGNVIHGKVGGGLMGSKLAHENEAPYPEWLVEPFVRSFCPPGGIVLDPFCGSGTTGAVAFKHGRNFIGIDMRGSQYRLTERRLAEVGGAQ